MFDLGSVIAHIKADVSDFKKNMSSAQSSMKEFSDGLKNQGTKLTAFVTTPILGLGAVALKSAADMEQLQVAFTTMLGSADKANKLLGELQQFAATTPFQLGDIQSAGKALLAFGIESDKIVPSLKSIGDIASGVGVNIDDLAVIYGKARTAGTLYSEDINQLTERGVPIIAQLAKQFKTSEDNIKKLASEGKIKFKDLETAFQSLTGEGGQFFNLMDAQSKTAAGQFSNFQDSLSQLGREIGAILLPYAVELLKAVQGLVSWFAGLDENQKRVIVTVLGIIAVVGPLLIILGTVIGVITSVVAAFTTVITVIGSVIAFFAALSLAPVLLIAAITGLIIFIAYFLLQWTGTWDQVVAVFQNMVNAVWGFISWLISGLMGIFQSFYMWLVGGSLIPDLVNQVLGWITFLKNTFVSIIQTMVNILMAVFQNYVNFWKTMIMIIYDFATGNWESMWNRIKTLFNDGLNFVRNIGESIKNAIMEPFNRAKQAAEDAINAIKEKMKDLNPMQRHSPSVVDLVRMGVDALEDQYARLGSFGMPGAGELAGGAATIPAGGGLSGIVVNLPGAQISSPQDATMYGEMIGDTIISKLKKSVRF